MLMEIFRSLLNLLAITENIFSFSFWNYITFNYLFFFLSHAATDKLILQTFTSFPPVLKSNKSGSS